MKLLHNLSSHNKLIIIISQLIVINIFIIFNLLINNRPPVEKPVQISNAKVVTHKPTVGFGEILAKTFPEPQVLAVVEEITPTPAASPTIKPRKDHYVIAVIGDSMVETMGENLDYLQSSLKLRYPETKFTLYNYGVGSEKITDGIKRVDKTFGRNGRQYPSLTELKPDVIIVGSWAYNPFDDHDSQKHRDQLGELVNSARSMGKVYMLAEIAPLETGFGTGPGGVNWPEELTKVHVQRIQEQMQNVFNVSLSLTVPVIDTYSASKVPGSNFGRAEYVSTHDHIHPSILGQIFTARIIASAIELE